MSKTDKRGDAGPHTASCRCAHGTKKTRIMRGNGMDSKLREIEKSMVFTEFYKIRRHLRAAI